MSQNSKTQGGGAVTALKSPLSIIDYDLREDLYSPGKNGVIGNINLATIQAERAIWINMWVTIEKTTILLTDRPIQATKKLWDRAVSMKV